MVEKWGRISPCRLGRTVQDTRGVKAKGSGAGANRVNSEAPASWSANRIQPLCLYPEVARTTERGVWTAQAVLTASDGCLKVEALSVPGFCLI